jgi:hypothetical protein
MDELRSIRFSSRARTSNQRGFALILAIALAVLFLGLIELMLIDASRALDEARRFRARTLAAALAENGAELAARDLLSQVTANVSYQDEQGAISGELRKNAAGEFTITGTGQTSGVLHERATVRVLGRVVGNEIRIQYTMHTQ